MNTPVREGETIEGSRTMRNRPYPVLKCSRGGWRPEAAIGGVAGECGTLLAARQGLSRLRVPPIGTRVRRHRDSARSLDPFAARGRRPRVRGGWRPEAAFGGVGSAERYWRRDRASLGCVCRPSARGCADIATLPLARPFCRERAPAACNERWLAAWRPEAAFGGVSVRC